MALGLWLLKHRGADHDQNEAFVIAAKTWRKARKIAADNASHEGPVIWLQPEWSSIKRIGVALPSIREGVAHVDFRAG